MNKWIEIVAAVIVAIFFVAACAGIYVAWRDCVDSGGVAVRGMFSMECMKR